LNRTGKIGVITFLLALTLLPGVTVVTASSITPWFRSVESAGNAYNPVGVHWSGHQLIVVSSIYPSSSSRIYGSVMRLSLGNGSLVNATVFLIQGFGDTIPGSSLYDTGTGALYIAGRIIRQYPYANSAFIAKIDPETGRTYWTGIFNASLLGWNALSFEDLCLLDGYIYATGFYMNNVAGNEDILLVKANSTDGSLLWAKTFSRSNEQELGYGITCAENNVYVLASLSYNNGRIHRVAVLDFSVNGTYKWGREIGGSVYMSTGDIEYGDGIVYTLNALDFYSLLLGSIPILTAVNATDGRILWNKIENNTASIINFQPTGGIYYKDHKLYVASFDTDIVNNTFIIYDRLSLAKINPNSTVEWFYALGGASLDIYPISLYIIELQGNNIPVAVGLFDHPGLTRGTRSMFAAILQNHMVPTVYTWTNGENFSNLTLVDPSTPKNKTIVVPYYGNFTVLVKDAWEDATVTNRSIPSSELYPVSNTGLQWIPGNLVYMDPATVYGSLQYHLAIANTSIVLSTPYSTVGGIILTPPVEPVGGTSQLAATATLSVAAIILALLSRRAK